MLFHDQPRFPPPKALLLSGELEDFLLATNLHLDQILRDHSPIRGERRLKEDLHALQDASTEALLELVRKNLG